MSELEISVVRATVVHMITYPQRHEKVYRFRYLDNIHQRARVYEMQSVVSGTSHRHIKVKAFVAKLYWSSLSLESFLLYLLKLYQARK
jgi:hypothetical protein